MPHRINDTPIDTITMCSSHESYFIDDDIVDEVYPHFSWFGVSL